MNRFRTLAVACGVLTLACGVWIAGISLWVFHSLDVSAAAAWMVFGSLAVVGVLAIFMIVYEMRHAIDVSPYIDPEELGTMVLPPDWHPLQRPPRMSLGGPQLGVVGPRVG